MVGELLVVVFGSEVHIVIASFALPSASAASCAVMRWHSRAFG